MSKRSGKPATKPKGRKGAKKGKSKKGVLKFVDGEAGVGDDSDEGTVPEPGFQEPQVNVTESQQKRKTAAAGEDGSDEDEDEEALDQKQEDDEMIVNDNISEEEAAVPSEEEDEVRNPGRLLADILADDLETAKETTL